MITRKEVESIHDVLIERFGGGKGIRDASGLESAINRPYQTFGGQDLYPTALEKAAALFESIISNHPFVDGNKRTAYVLMRLLLNAESIELTASQQEKYDFVIRAAQGELTFDKILQWIRANSK